MRLIDADSFKQYLADGLKKLIDEGGYTIESLLKAEQVVNDFMIDIDNQETIKIAQVADENIPALETMGKCGGCKYCYYFEPCECYLCGNTKGLKDSLNITRDYCSKFTVKSIKKGDSK